VLLTVVTAALSFGVSPEHVESPVVSIWTRSSGSRFSVFVPSAETVKEEVESRAATVCRQAAVFWTVTVKSLIVRVVDSGTVPAVATVKVILKWPTALAWTGGVKSLAVFTHWTLLETILRKVARVLLI